MGGSWAPTSLHDKEFLLGRWDCIEIHLACPESTAVAVGTDLNNKKSECRAAEYKSSPKQRRNSGSHGAKAVRRGLIQLRTRAQAEG